MVGTTIKREAKIMSVLKVYVKTSSYAGVVLHSLSDNNQGNLLYYWSIQHWFIMSSLLWY